MHEIGFARVFKLGLWQLHLRVGIGAAAQSYIGMPKLATVGANAAFTPGSLPFTGAGVGEVF